MYYFLIIIWCFLLLFSKPFISFANLISSVSNVSILDCNNKTINLGKLAVKSEAKEALVGYTSTTVAGFRLDVDLPPCCHELNFINLVIQDDSPPSWVDENNNTHQLVTPYIDPPWKWNPGNVTSDDKPFYDGQVRNMKASETGGSAGEDFALNDLLKTQKDDDPILSVVFGDRPKFSSSIKFATLLTCVDENAKKLSVLKSFTWGAEIKGNKCDTLPIQFYDGLPKGISPADFQSALDKSGFGADIKNYGVLQHKGEG